MSPAMIAVNQLGKRYGAQILFGGVTLKFNPGQCYGIVGANGSGKSTFLRILTGEEESSEGERIIPGDCRLGFLRQDRFRDLNQTIMDVAMMGDEAVFEALTEITLSSEVVKWPTHVPRSSRSYKLISAQLTQRVVKTFVCHAWLAQLV